jgi:hypothetical protein
MKLSLIKINKISLLKMSPRDNTPLGKGKDHQSNVGDAKKIICTRISLTKERERRPCTKSKRIQQ